MKTAKSTFGTAVFRVEEDETMPKPKYHTPIEGMKGTGEPLINAQPANADPDPNTLSGGTFAGMQITKEVKEQIEKSTASDFLYFTESAEEADVFDMHTKLPEYGCAGEGQPVFKLRENMNRLMKGTAKKFLKPDGSVDAEAGLKFVYEMALRFGWGQRGGAFCPEFPLETDKAALRQHAQNWLCSELEIPEEEQADFKNFCEGMLGLEKERKAIRFSTFSNLWSNFSGNYFTLEELRKKEGSPFAGIVPGGNADNLYQKSVNECENMNAELKRIAGIDPAQEKGLIMPNECEGSAEFIQLVAKSANFAAKELGKETEKNPEQFFHINLKNAHPGKETVWDVHFAGVIGTFTTGEGEAKKTWYLTAEAFAPGGTSMVKHPGITDEISIGIYSGEQDFVHAYGQASSTVIDTDAEKEFTQIWDENFHLGMEKEDDILIGMDEVQKARKKEFRSLQDAYEKEKQSLRENVILDADDFTDLIRDLRENRGEVAENDRGLYDRMLRSAEDIAKRGANAEANRRICEKLHEQWEDEIAKLEEKAGFVMMDADGNALDFDAEIAKKRQELERLDAITEGQREQWASADADRKVWDTLLRSMKDGRELRTEEDLKTLLGGQEGLDRFRATQKRYGLEENRLLSVMDAQSRSVREFRQLEQAQEVPKYHTPVPGMQGTGEPIVPEGAYSALKEMDPAKVGGGAFTGMQVSEQVKQQIEQGSGADFFNFVPSKDNPDRYDMQPKLPEYGCEGAGKPVFKLRENQNRLMKGIAKKMLKKDGTMDLEGGIKFLKEFQARFGMEEYSRPYCPEMPLETDREVLQESAINWLCGEMEIPVEERTDFKNFARAVINFDPILDSNVLPDNVGKVRENGVGYEFLTGFNGLGQENLIDLWEGYLGNCRLAEEVAKKPEWMQGQPGKENIFQRNVRQYREAIGELKRYAEMDPKTEMSMIVPTECSGSTLIGRRQVYLAAEANKALGKEGKRPDIPDIGVAIEKATDRDLELIYKVDRNITALEEKKDTMERAAYDAELQKLKEERERAIELRREILKKQKGTTKEVRWQVHHTPVVGSFVDENGKTRYLTIEAFAPESDTLVEHPGATNQVAIGVYADGNDFADYYMKDNPYANAGQDTEEYLAFRKNNAKGNELLKDDFPTLMDEIPELEQQFGEMEKMQRKYQETYQMSSENFKASLKDARLENGWEQRRREAKNNPGKYKPTAGTRDADICSEYQEEFAELLRQAAAKQSGVPQEQQGEYARFLALCEDLLQKNIAYGRAFLIQDDMLANVPEEEQKYIRYAMRMDEKGNDLAAVDQEDLLENEMKEMILPLKRMLAGKKYDSRNDYGAFPNARNFFLQQNGYNLKAFENMINHFAQSMQPVKEVRMDVQAATRELALSFMKKDVWHMSPQEREFATQNMDVALDAVFSKAQKEELATKGMDVFDCIYIDGTSAAVMLEQKYASLGEIAGEAKKAEIMKKLLEGCQIDIARPDGKGGVDIVPLTASSEIPELEAGLSRQRYSGRERMDFSEKIRTQQKALWEGTLRKAEPAALPADAPQFTLQSRVDEKLFQQMAALKDWSESVKKGQQLPEGFTGMLEETKYQLGLMILEKMTGVKVDPDGKGADPELLKTVLDRFCVNGFTYKQTLESGITQENCREVIGGFALRMSDYFDENRKGTQETINLLEDGRLLPLTYTPPAPVAPKTEVTKKNAASRAAREQEERVFAEQKAKADKWEKLNRQAEDSTKAYDGLRQQTDEIEIEVETAQGKQTLKRNITVAEKYDPEIQTGIPQPVYVPAEPKVREKQPVQQVAEPKKTAPVQTGEKVQPQQYVASHTDSLTFSAEEAPKAKPEQKKTGGRVFEMVHTESLNYTAGPEKNDTALTLEQFMATFSRLGLSKENYQRLYQGLDGKEREQAALAAITGDPIYNIFVEWDAPLSRQYGNYPTKLPVEVRLCGNAGELNTWLDVHEKELNAADKAFVPKHIEVIEKVAKIGKEQGGKLEKENLRGTKPDVYTDEKGFSRLTISQPSGQNNSNGCWSVAMQQLIQSRGTEGIEQEDIRSYRPESYTMDKISSGKTKGDYLFADETMNRDQGNTITERLDPMLKFAPNSMARSVDIYSYRPDDPTIVSREISKEQYAAAAKELVRQTVEKAIYIDRSPLVIKDSSRDHFVNITGIKGDVLLIQDPLGGAKPEDRMYEMPIDRFVSFITDPYERNGTIVQPGEPLQLVWASDIHLDKAGRLIGNPDTGVTVAEDGTVVLNAGQQRENEGMIETIQDGCAIYRFGGKPAPDHRVEVQPLTEVGLNVTEQVYLPKKLNMAALTNEAKQRSDEQERKLKADAELYFAPQTELKGVSMKTAVEMGLDAAKAERDEKLAAKNTEALKQNEKNADRHRKIGLQELNGKENKEKQEQADLRRKTMEERRSLQSSAHKEGTEEIHRSNTRK